jgi:hypothetical protein
MSGTKKVHHLSKALARSYLMMTTLGEIVNLQEVNFLTIPPSIQSRFTLILDINSQETLSILIKLLLLKAVALSPSFYLTTRSLHPNIQAWHLIYYS